MRALAVFLLLYTSASGESIEVRLHPWPQTDHQGAVSLSFDDAYPSHCRVAMPLLEQHGFRGTFYVVVDKLRQQNKYRSVDSLPLETWQNAEQRGHEIGSHTMSHTDLQEAGVRQRQSELYVSKFVLDVLFQQASTTSLSYPHSGVDDSVIDAARNFYTSGRAGSIKAQRPFYNDPAQLDFFRLQSRFLCSGEKYAEWNELVDQTLAAGGWLIETLHPLDENGYCEIRALAFERHLNYLHSLKSTVWVAPVGQVAERIYHWRQSQVKAVPLNEQAYHLIRESPGKSRHWQVSIAINNPRDWRLVDGKGRAYPFRAINRQFNFTWPASAGNSLLLIKRVDGGRTP